MIYFTVALLLLYLIVKYDVEKKSAHKDFYFRLVLIVFIAIAGLRYRLGLDTVRYLFTFYHAVPLLSDLTIEDLAIGSDPLFRVLNSAVLTFGGKFFIVQIIQSAFVNILVFKYIKKHTPYIFTALFFYYLWQYYSYNMEELRASMALVICLFANDYCLEKKWVKAIVLYVVASLFHFSAIICILTPFLLFLRYNLIGLLICVSSLILGVFIGPFIASHLDYFSLSDVVQDKVATYVGLKEYFSSRINILGLFAYMILYAYPIISLGIIKKHDKSNPILQLEPLFMISFIVISVTLMVPLMYRYIHFYAIYYILLISDLGMRFIIVKNRRKGRKSLMQAFILLLPLLYLIISHFTNVDMYSRFYPYSSVIEKSVDQRREYNYSEHGTSFTPSSYEY